jgi:hypothetical protein
MDISSEQTLPQGVVSPLSQDVTGESIFITQALRDRDNVSAWRQGRNRRQRRNSVIAGWVENDLLEQVVCGYPEAAWPSREHPGRKMAGHGYT